MEDGELQRRIEAVRRFNRFYTKQIGVLHEGLLRSSYSLAEARVIYELANRGQTTATRLRHDLNLDGGYLSRILRRLDKAGLIDKRRSESDGRQTLLSLTEPGEAAFAVLNSRSRNEIGAMLGELSAEDQYRLVSAMHTVELMLGADPEQRTPYLLRPHQPGDMGWVVHRHGVLYAEEYGFDESFEALVARVVAAFIDDLDPKRERCWIAERDGEVVGSVFLVAKSKRVAQLRLLLVEPKARGLGIGARLVEECIRFARRTGYAKITLWTNSILLAARHIYEEAGFDLVETEPHHSFGHDLVSEIWELPLGRPKG
ncbi:MAG: helix-turn-helix domain-containing GNAT family N-acetyltransferase [Alphaproteobacteria bacterium]|jgi:DNA-binding MarR family transcriptional regulator/N-acetylglutamate synthase-like GNAT family acetyltransferase|nr:helix-turn-helix domain-containing GNAT family N-acetyltransferase [Alphaproteobacteria bacterium]